jgi:endonuclease/exonuclease/phosphatase (EEP) superfamily protein YafD
MPGNTQRSGTAVAIGQGFLGFALVTSGVVATLATILGFFGSSWWLFDWAANFRPHLAVILIIVALAYSLLFAKVTGLFFLAMALVNIAVILPLYTRSPAAAAGTADLKVVSFDVAQRSSIRDITYQWIESVEPDIVILLDSTDPWQSVPALAEPYRVQTELPADRAFGITVLSRDDLETQLLRASQVNDSVVRIEAALGTQPIVIYAVQTRIPNSEGNATYRNEYLEDVAEMVRSESLPTVVVGDLNATPWSSAFRALTSKADLENSMDGFGLQTSWPADRWAFMRLPMDHLLHTAELTTISRELGPTFGVDHRPLIVTLAMAAG